MFISCLTTLIIFNFLFFITGLNTDILSASSIIGIMVSLAVIAVAVSLIPTTSASGSMNWLMGMVIAVSLFFSVSFTVFTYDITIGVGLATHITDMFPLDMESLMFMPWLFFTIIGILGTVSGIMAMSGGE